MRTAAYLWLEIAMNDVLAMAVVHAVDDLMKEAARLALAHTSVGHNVVKKLATASIA